MLLQNYSGYIVERIKYPIAKFKYMKGMEKDLAPYEKIVLDKDKKAEIRIYDGDKDPNVLNRKRIGVYLYIDNKFAASEWVNYGRVVNNIIMHNPRITLKKRQELTDIAIENMKNKWIEVNK